MKTLMLLTLLITSCVQPILKTPTIIPVKPPTSVPAVVFPSVGWDVAFDQMIYTEVYKTSLLSLPGSRMNFCPRWDKLATTQKAQEIANLFHGIAVYESDLQLNNYYVESTLGTDLFTGSQVASEGLLQLSYQDAQSYPEGCGGISWIKDKSLSKTDVNRTIFQPQIQFKCAIYIANRIMTKRSEPLVGVGAVGIGRYWSTVREDHKLNQIKGKMISYGSECFL